MDSPIVKATIQSTFLGALSNVLGQLIGCWQSEVSRISCADSDISLTITVAIQHRNSRADGLRGFLHPLMSTKLLVAIMARSYIPWIR